MSLTRPNDNLGRAIAEIMIESYSRAEREDMRARPFLDCAHVAAYYWAMFHKLAARLT